MALDTSKHRNPEIRRWYDQHINRVARLVNLGTPVVADPDKIVTIANMKVGAYTIAAQPDVPRNITLTHAAVGAADTLGTVTVVGTDVNDQPITEVLTPVSGTLVAGLRAFKTVVSVTGAGWVIGEGNDTILVGVGTVLGLPFILNAATDVQLGILGVAPIVPTTVFHATEISKNTTDISSGTYNGSKVAFVFVVE